MFEALMVLLGVPQSAWPSAVTGFFSFLGLLLTGLFGVCAWLTRQWFLRSERKRDVMQALRSEIMSVWLQLSRSVIDEATEKFVRQKLKGREKVTDYAPFVAQADGIKVYPALITQIAVLDEDDIPDVVAFYRQMALIEEFGVHLRSRDYATFANGRKLDMILHYWNMNENARDLAKTCLNRLEQELKVKSYERSGYVLKRYSAADRNGQG